MPYSENQVKTIRAIKGIAETPAGMTFLDFLKTFCYAQERTFVVNDPYLSAFREGMRSVFLEIERLKNVDETTLFNNQPIDPYHIEDIAI